MANYRIIKHYLLIIPALLLLLTGCDGKKTADEIFSDSASGVVVILNKYYYEIALEDGEKLYFKGLDENGELQGLTADKAEIANNCSMMTGTGFFIDKEGSIVTNRHVASPVIDKAEAKRGMLGIMRKIKTLYEMQMSQLTDQYNQLEAQKANCTYEDEYGMVYTDEQQMAEISQQQSALQEQYVQLSSERDGLSDNIDPEGIKINPVCEIGIAYNNTYVTNEKDFLESNPCVVVKVSDKEDVDLALLQLKNKKTPDGAHIFAVEGDETASSFTDKIKSMFQGKDDKKLHIDQQLYMIGYNAGLVLANTKQGIKVQMTSGKVTQMPDGQRLLYSIPTMQGSSGSPVVDEYGTVVAVNFAKLNGTDNFNFGIPAKKLSSFLKE